MLRINKNQMDAIKQQRLLVVKQEILNTLQLKYPEQAIANEKQLEEFIRCSMEAARAILIDNSKQIRRFVSALFILEFILKDTTKLKYFSQVMLSEESIEAKLLFIENNLLKINS